MGVSQLTLGHTWDVMLAVEQQQHACTYSEVRTDGRKYACAKLKDNAQVFLWAENRFTSLWEKRSHALELCFKRVRRASAMPSLQVGTDDKYSR